MTKKNKILTIFFSVLAGIILIVVLSSTLFAVGKIEVVWQSEKINMNSVPEQEIIQNSTINKGTNVFLVEKSKAKSNLEKTFPYIKVLNIETVFPNVIKIHMVEREETFAISKNGKSYILDSDLKVLKVVNIDYDSTKENAIEILGFDDFDASLGEFLKVDSKYDSLKAFEECFYQNYTKEESVNAHNNMLAFFKSVKIVDDKMVLNTFFGVKIQIYNPCVSEQQKLSMLIQTLDKLSSEEKSKGTISIFSKDGKIVSSYNENE